MKRREVIAVLTAVTIGVRPGFASAQTNGLKLSVLSTSAALTSRASMGREIVPKLRRMSPSTITGLAPVSEAAGKLEIEVMAQQVTSSEELRDRLHALTAAETEAYFFTADFLVVMDMPLVIERQTLYACLPW